MTIKVGDVVRITEEHKGYADRFWLVGNLVVDSINEDNCARFKDKDYGAFLHRLEKVNANPFIKTETETIVKEVKKFNGDETTFGRLSLSGSSKYVSIKTWFGSTSVKVEEIDSLIKHLQLYKEAVEETTKEEV